MFCGEKTILRPLELEDSTTISENWNQWAIRRNHYNHLPRSKPALQKWLEKAMVDEPWKDGSISFAVCDKDSRSLIGTCSLHGIEPRNRNAELTISIHDQKGLGRGYGGDAATILLWFGFHILGLNSIYLGVFDFNDRAIKCFEKLGFRYDGKIREGAFIEGKFRDILVYSLLQREFFQKYPPGTTNPLINEMP